MIKWSCFLFFLSSRFRALGVGDKRVALAGEKRYAFAGDKISVGGIEGGVLGLGVIAAQISRLRPVRFGKMAALQVGGLNVACLSHPRFARKVKEKAFCSCSYIEHTNIQSSWTCNFTKLVLRSSQHQQYGCYLSSPSTRNRTRLFQALSFQDVAENDSEGNDAAASSSAPTLDWQQREKMWHQLQGSLQHWRQNLKDRGSLQIAKDLLTITEVKLKGTDAKQILTQKLQKIKAPEPLTLWSSIDPSIKWPLLIFVSFYLIVTISCGVAVSRELWPLWTIWPLAASFYIRVGMYAAHMYQTYGAPYTKMLVQRSIQLVADVRTGKFHQDVRSGLAYAKKYVATKRAASIHYLKTRAASDLKEALIRFGMWLVERYEDLVDWLWPSWRIFRRLLQNLL